MSDPEKGPFVSEKCESGDCDNCFDEDCACPSHEPDYDDELIA